ncbi:hypothetical protein EON81_19015 [bacterium]|nr:MAG: hypothetical protein EON81_19015 [bacterium]
MTVYGLHTLTGILGPAKRVTAMSGILIPEREFQGQMYETSADDNSVMLLDFGGGTFAFVQGTATGSLGGYFHEPTFFGTGGTIQGLKLNGEEIDWEGKGQRHAWGPHIVGEHAQMGEHHVFEDLMQLVDWVREDKPSVATAEHGAHVVDIIESAYKSAETGQAQELRSSF